MGKAIDEDVISWFIFFIAKATPIFSQQTSHTKKKNERKKDLEKAMALFSTLPIDSWAMCHGLSLSQSLCGT